MHCQFEKSDWSKKKEKKRKKKGTHTSNLSSVQTSCVRYEREIGLRVALGESVHASAAAREGRVGGESEVGGGGVPRVHNR